MYIDIPIAVTPVVKAFLQHKFSIEPHFVLSQDNKYGIFLYNCLGYYKKRTEKTTRAAWRIGEKQREARPKTKKAIYTETIYLRISEETCFRNGFYLSAAKQISFNRMVQFDIDECFCLWVDCCVALNGMTLYKSFFSFREKFHLEEDNLTLKAMEKKYERYRHRISA